MSAKFVNIGVDQGRCNFAIVAVDKEVDHPPMVIAAAKYNLALGVQFSASDVLLKLQEAIDLWSWMQQTDDRPVPEVDQVNVLTEQMSVRNRHCKQFGVDLGKLLQQSVNDEGKCVVHLLQPHLFRVGGVIDHAGVQIVQESSLTQCRVEGYRVRTAVTQSRTAKYQKTTVDNVEPPDTGTESDHDMPDDSYCRKKQMSASICRYFMEADASKQADMQVNVCPQWQKI